MTLSNHGHTSGQPTHRRDFLASVAAGAAGALALGHQPRSAVAATKDADPVIPIVDTHQHLWDLKKLTLPWLKNDGAQLLNRDFLMADYLKATKGLGVSKTVYMEVNVQQSHQDREAEWVTGLCADKKNPMQAAVIGGYPHDRGFKKYIQKYAENDYIRGVRTVLHDPDRPTGLCLEKRFVKNCKLLGKLGMSFDLCMRPDELADGARLVEKCPKTRFVVDHCGNMSVSSTDKALRKKWMAGIKALASHENVVCKISGIIVTAKEGWTAKDLAPNMLFCMDTFGEDRAYFAGDWPVCRLRATFAQWAGALKTIVKDRPLAFQKKLFHENAERFYRI
ncbi:MAG: amidohydrolase family protein [Planctomycetaceae bacterium]